MSFSEVAIWLVVILIVFIIPVYLTYKIIFCYTSKVFTKLLYVFLAFTPILGIVFYFFYITEKNTKAQTTVSKIK